MNTAKIIFFFLFISMVINSVSAQLLWKIEGNGLDNSSYVYGTMHVLCPDDIAISDKVKLAYQNATALVVELNPSNPALITEMQQLSVNPGFVNIYKELSTADYQKIDKVLTENYGAGLDQLGILKPFVLTSMITMTLLPCKQPESLDGYFVKKTNEDDKTIIELETARFQMGIFDEIPAAQQIQELLKMLDGDGADDFESLKKAYLAQDLSALEELIATNEMMKEWEHLLLSNRNKQWVKVLKSLMPQKTLFIAVGAGHLPGEKGVLELLRKEGFQVSPVW
jgi:uncharacterized protein YbaP (TraB family)